MSKHYPSIISTACDLVEKLCLGFKFKQTVFEFDPLIKLEFGNIIPLKPLKFNLLTIGEGVKLMGKEL